MCAVFGTSIGAFQLMFLTLTKELIYLFIEYLLVIHFVLAIHCLDHE